MKKRLLSWILTLSMMIALIPQFAVCVEAKEGLGPKTMEGGQRDFKWPVPGYYGLSSCFYDNRIASGDSKEHYALDIATGGVYANVVASYDGIVYQITTNGNSDGGYGNAVMVKHSYTTSSGNTVTLYSRYAHLHSISVKTGDSVVAGKTVLGKVGGSGYGSTPYPVHLDFQILTAPYWGQRELYSIDPYANYLLELPSTISKGGTTECCQRYIDLVKALYAQYGDTSNEPGKPAFTNLKSKYSQNTAIEFSWKPTANTTHYNFWLYKKDSSGNWKTHKHTSYVESGFTLTLEAGEYRALLQSYNSNEWKPDYSDWLYTESDYAYFTVVVPNDPGKPAFTNLKSKYPQNATIEFSWKSTTNTTHYNFWLYKKDASGNWKTHNHTFYVESGFTLTLEAGEYRALLQSYNSNEWKPDYSDWLYTESDYAYFTVLGEHTCTKGTYKYAWSAHPHYKCYECTVCGEVWADKSEPTVRKFCTDCSLVFDTNGGTLPSETASHSITGFNIDRGSNALVVYTDSGQIVNTNIHGSEVVVDSNGMVTAQRLYGDSKQVSVPEGGFVVSGHAGGDSSTFVSKISVGYYVAYNQSTNMLYVYSDKNGYLANQKYVASGDWYRGLPIPERDGYVFDGWYTSADGGTEVKWDTTYSTQKLYAHWIKADQVQASFTYQDKDNNRIYERYDCIMSWEDAKEFCENRGGHLVTITSQKEQNLIMSSGLLDNTRRGIYAIGATDSATEGNWKWVTDEAFSFNAWDTSAPEPSNGSGENFAYIMAVDNPPNKAKGEWNDGPNLDLGDGIYSTCNIGFICEYEVDCIHDYALVDMERGCTENGCVMAVCNRCGDSYEVLVSPALGHHYENGACTRCGAEDPNFVPSVSADGVTRVYGNDRYATAFKAADALKENLGVQKFENIVVACGTDFADALSGSYLANQKNAPILLVRNNKNTMNSVKDYIKKNLVSGGTVYLLGGKNAIPVAMESGLDGFTVKRLAGNTRYDTNLEILKEAGVGDKDILVCTGKNFADGLSASAVNKPILLVKDSLNAAQKEFLSGLSGNKIYVIGGTNAVSAKTESALGAYGSVTRISGASRYDTSVNIAKEFFPNASSAVLAYGQNFPDGLSAGSLACSMNAPLILTSTNKPDQAVTYVTAAGIKSGAVLGGPGLISDKVVKRIFSMGTDDQITVK